MNAELLSGGQAAKAAAVELAIGAHASVNPVNFVRGVTTMIAGSLAAAVGHEVVAQILIESASIIRTAAEMKKDGRSA